MSKDTVGSLSRFERFGPSFAIAPGGGFANGSYRAAAGSYLTFEVVSMENGVCDDIILTGVIETTVFRRIGSPASCGSTAPVTTGPVAADGYYWLTSKYSAFEARYGAPIPDAKMVGLDDGSYMIFIEDGTDADWNDIVLRVRVQRAPAHFTCNGVSGPTIAVTVIRGSEIDCTVTSGPDGSTEGVVISSWAFEGKPREDGDPTSPRWKGTMAKGGEIAVIASIGGGPPQPLRAAVTVQDRDWNPGPRFHALEVPNGSDPRLGRLPSTIRYAEHLGHTNFFKTEDPSRAPEDPTKLINGGPNDGLYYYHDLGFFAYMPVYINREAMAPRRPFYEAQESNSGTGSSSTIGGINWCSRSVLARRGVEGITDHEWKHISEYQNHRTTRLLPIMQRLEAVTDLEDDAEMVANYWAEWDAADAAARVVADRPVDVRHPLRLYDGAEACALKNEFGEMVVRGPSTN